MLQIIHTSFWKFSKLSNGGILNWSIFHNYEVRTGNTTAYFFCPLCTVVQEHEHTKSVSEGTVTCIELLEY